MIDEKKIGNAITAMSGITKMEIRQKRMKMKVLRLAKKVKKQNKNQTRRLLANFLNAARRKLSCQLKRDISRGNASVTPRRALGGMTIAMKIRIFKARDLIMPSGHPKLLPGWLDYGLDLHYFKTISI